eukprot:TRINITY_DN19376_c0_g1_i3.p1 TRINITY_DN19376_c0_g1~~TRINITY_DN19376_c0_g1_i3.p1  ORF type:complete len:254 (-),score=57.47 TRINITY_DN19376_c0_g1_i3:382-1143(-)
MPDTSIIGPEHMYFDIMAAVAGLFMGLLGYRCYRPCLFVSGYLLGGAAAYHLAHREDEFEHTAIAFAAGVVCGFWTSNCYPIGVTALGFIWGCSAVLVANPIAISRIGHAFGLANTLFWAAIIVVGGICAVVSLIAHQHHPEVDPTHPRKLLIFVKTAMPGAYLLSKGACALAGMHQIAELDMSQHSTLPAGNYLRSVLAIGFGVAFAGAQLLFTHKEQCGWGEMELGDLDTEEQKRLVAVEESAKNDKLSHL